MIGNQFLNKDADFVCTHRQHHVHLHLAKGGVQGNFSQGGFKLIFEYLRRKVHII